MTPAPQWSDCVIRTRCGNLRGRKQDEVLRFLGVPYAAPPVGTLRFQKPEPAAAWTGTRDATARGPNAPQIVRAFPGLDMTPLVGKGWQRGDDYLTLNIWTPDPGAKNLPVMVFIHGGAFVVGSSDCSVHDGLEFARSGVVFASVNYRLGVEGFLAIPGVPTNLGLRDLIAALHWIRENIGSFGGDPANLTVAGESAGAMAVANLMASPLARGLFRRAIVQSGHGSMVRSPQVAARLVESYAKQLRVAPDARGFAGCSSEQCAAAVDALSRPEVRIDMTDTHGRDCAFGITRFLPVYGDDILPELPLEALASGSGAEVDLLIGTTREEMNIYLVPTGVKAAIDARSAIDVLSGSVPNAKQILTEYGIEGEKNSPGTVLASAMTDLVFRLPARRFAAAHRGRTHCYEFGWRSPALGGELGACHALDLPFVFKTLDTCAGPMGIAGMHPPESLADRVHGVWVDAISGRFAWPEYSDASPLVLSLETGAAAREERIPAAAPVPA
jgi:para-nitrobenzyl esterase